MVRPGDASIFYFNDTDEMSVMNNLVIAWILRGVRAAQEDKYNQALLTNFQIDQTLIMVEKTQEFLSRDTINEMPVVFRQLLRRTALLGRKRGRSWRRKDANLQRRR